MPAPTEGPAASAATSSGSAPVVVAVVDRSGSMGNLGNEIVQAALPAALLDAGLAATTPVTLILFESRTTVKQVALQDLYKEQAGGAGSTVMGPAILALQAALLRHSDVPVVIVVVSDGEVNDGAQVVAAATALAGSPSIQARAAPISVVMVRAFTSTYGTPDMRAMSCLGALDTSGRETPGVVTVQAGPRFRTEFVEQVRGALTQVRARRCVVAVPDGAAAGLRTLPSQPWKASLELRDGEYVLVAPGIASLVVDGAPVDLTVPAGDPSGFLEGFLQAALAILRVWAVAGTRAGDLTTALEWFQDFNRELAEVSLEEVAGAGAAGAGAGAASAAGTAAAAPPGGLTYRARLAQLLRAARREARGALADILALRNASAVSSLNAAQAYNFLRGGITSKGLAKRNTTTDFTAAAQASATAILEGKGPVPPDAVPTAVSFYSLTTWAERLEDFRANVRRDDVANMSAGDLLSMVGGQGVPVRTDAAGDLADPWRAYVTDVYCGSYLAECDVVTAAGLTAAGAQTTRNVLTAPGHGPDAVITGVVPLRDLNPGAYDAYMRARGGLADLHASVTLRGNLATVPQDALALHAATAVCLLGNKVLSTAQLEVLRSIVGQVRDAMGAPTLRAIYTPLAEGLAGPHPAASLVGDGGTAMLKGLAVVLACPEAAPVRASRQVLVRALAALYDLDVYWRVRGSKDLVSPDKSVNHGARAGALAFVLGVQLPGASAVDVDADAPPIEVDEAAVQATVDMDAVAARAKAPGFRTRKSAAMGVLHRLPAALKALTGEDCDGEAGAAGDAPAPAFLNRPWLHAAAVVHALQCPDEAARRDSSNAVSEFATPEGCAAYVKSVVVHLAREAHAARRKAWDTAQADRLLAIQVRELLAADTVTGFVQGLVANVPDRQRPGFALVLQGVVAEAHAGARTFPDVPLSVLAAKAFVLLTGRHADGNVLWAQGNVASDPAVHRRLRPVLQVLDDPMWNLAALKTLPHTYRSGAPNHSGHSNDLPSYFTMGYTTMEDMEAKVSPEEFAAYRAAHAPRGCCGFATAAGLTRRNRFKRYKDVYASAPTGPV
jgi:hypothetical protein